MVSLLSVVGAVLSCRISIRIAVHPAPRPEHVRPSVAVIRFFISSFRRYALAYLFVYWVCLIEKSLHVPAMFSLVLLGPSLTHTGCRGSNRQMEQAEIENYNTLSPPQDIYGDSGFSAPPESSSTMIAGSLFSPLAGSYTQFGVQGDYADAFPQGQVEGTTLSLEAAQGQSEGVVRKHDQRFDDEQDFAKICEPLDIQLKLKKPSSVAVSVCVFILVGGIQVECFIVLGVLVDQQKLESDLRCRLKKYEAYIHFVNAVMTDLPTREDIGSQSSRERFGQVMTRARTY
jgi:hypothetical protein